MADDDPQGSSLREVTEWSGGLSWIAYPDEQARRASHALQTEAGVWLVDPVDADGLDERVTELGKVAGVLVVQDRHTRDAEAVARRHDVAVYVPDWMRLTREKLETTAESVGSELPGTNYTVHRLLDTDDWEEAVLVDETTNTLLVPEALVPHPESDGDDTALRVHPSLDEPPRRLTDWTPDRILLGHGKSIHSDANTELRETLDAK